MTIRISAMDSVNKKQESPAKLGRKPYGSRDMVRKLLAVRVSKETYDFVEMVDRGLTQTSAQKGSLGRAVDMIVELAQASAEQLNGD